MLIYNLIDNERDYLMLDIIFGKRTAALVGIMFVKRNDSSLSAYFIPDI